MSSNTDRKGDLMAKLILGGVAVAVIFALAGAPSFGVILCGAAWVGAFLVGMDFL